MRPEPLSLEGKSLHLECDPCTLELTVTHRGTGQRWALHSDSEGELRVAHHSTATTAFLRDAREREVYRYSTSAGECLCLHLRGLPGGVALSITFSIPSAEDTLRIELEPLPTASSSRIVEVRYPGVLAFEADEIQYTVWPNGAGMILPARHDQEIHSGMSDYETQVKGLPYALAYSWQLYQPWWGAVAANSAYVAIAETPFDFGLELHHPAGGPTVARPVWVSSLGDLAYRRAIRYQFFGDASYVTLAKAYRRYAQGLGRWVALETKFARNPHARRLVGSTIFPVSICRHNMRQSPPCHEVVTFAEALRHVRRLRDLGWKRAYLHIDGWGARGYDNQHPDPLPPCSDAGGWTGLVELSRTAEECGYLFGLHDQYRDYYLDGPGYCEAHAVKMADGALPQWSRWAGGPQTLLCAQQALPYLRANYARIMGHGVRLTASYLDVYAMNPLDECHDPRHPMTREDCYRWRAEALEHMHRLDMAVSSEEPADCFIPHLDFAHWNGYPREKTGPLGYLGVPVPLHNLVYHDALLLPSQYRYAHPTPRDAQLFLEGLAQVEIPYGQIGWAQPEDLRGAQLMARLHAAWGTSELTNHRILDSTGAIQEYEYPEGRVLVDLGSCRYRIHRGPEATDGWLSPEV